MAPIHRYRYFSRGLVSRIGINHPTRTYLTQNILQQHQYQATLTHREQLLT